VADAARAPRHSRSRPVAYAHNTIQTSLNRPYRPGRPSGRTRHRHLQFALFDRGAQDRRCRTQFCDSAITFCRIALPAYHRLAKTPPSPPVQRLPPAMAYGRATACRPSTIDRGIDRTTAIVAEHQDQRHVQHRHRIFHARDHFVGSEVAGNPAHEEIAAAAVEGIFGRDPRIRQLRIGSIGF